MLRFAANGSMKTVTVFKLQLEGGHAFPWSSASFIWDPVLASSKYFVAAKADSLRLAARITNDLK